MISANLHNACERILVQGPKKETRDNGDTYYMMEIHLLVGGKTVSLAIFSDKPQRIVDWAPWAPHGKKWDD